MAYTTKAKVENYLMINIDSSFDSQIDLWIKAVDRFIDRYTHRVFGASTATKYYDGVNSNELIIDTFNSLTSVELLDIDGDVEHSLTEGTDYIVYPLNGEMKYKIILTNYAVIQTFAGYDNNKKRVKIVGSFGSSKSDKTVPDDIELVSTMLVAQIINQVNKGGDITSESLGDYSVSFEKDLADAIKITNVKTILDTYKIFEV